MDKITQFIPMSLETNPGMKVRYLGVNGYAHQRNYADRILTVGHSYTVSSIHIGDWSSTVQLAEFPGENFNTVMFENC